MDYAWRITLAAIGLFWLRSAVYSVHWGHGGGVRKVLGVAVSVALIWPLWDFSPGSHAWLIGVGAVWLLPWRQLVVALVRRNALAGARRLAQEWGTALKHEGDLWEASAGKRWMGNVLTRVRSLHPGVRGGQTYYMLGFSRRLDAVPPFQCSIMRGWAEPKYFENEWRETTTMQGEMLAMSLGGLLDEGGRKTGGDAKALADWELADPRLQTFSAKGDVRERFDAVFGGELLDQMLGCAAAIQFELNVTPTSVNIYTVYAGFERQKRNAEFLERLAAKLGA
jgi:hypothetical protein